MIDSIWIHPDVMGVLCKQISVMPLYDSFHLRPLFSLPVYQNINIPKYPQKWVTRPHSWIEYNEADEVWAKPIGYGQYLEDTTRYVIYIMKDYSDKFTVDKNI